MITRRLSDGTYRVTWLDQPFEGPPTVLTASQGVLDLG